MWRGNVDWTKRQDNTSDGNYCSLYPINWYSWAFHYFKNVILNTAHIITPDFIDEGKVTALSNFQKGENDPAILPVDCCYLGAKSAHLPDQNHSTFFGLEKLSGSLPWDIRTQIEDIVTVNIGNSLDIQKCLFLIDVIIVIMSCMQNCWTNC